jgi:Deoxycytidylate deaminase
MAPKRDYANKISSEYSLSTSNKKQKSTSDEIKDQYTAIELSSPHHEVPNLSNPGKPDKEEEMRSLMLKEAGYDIHDASNVKKRQNYMSWDDYFMAVSFLSAQRSKDPQEQKGACIVDEDNRIVGIGYNGFPRGCCDDSLPWASTNDCNVMLHTKHPFLCHAEINAILNKCSADVKGTRMYVSEIPDNIAAKTIIQAGISEVVYVKDADNSEAIQASRIMFQMSGVKMRQYTPNPITPLNFSEFHANTLGDNDASIQSATDHIAPRYQDLLRREASFDPMDSKVKKRKNYLSWDDYFTSVAFLSARRSKDPNTQVGACIVDANQCIIGIGYNGFPRGCSDDHLPWARVADAELHKKYPYVVHAEVNAILNKGSKDVKGASLYVALFPCCECAKIIIQSGIKEVIYLSDVVST